MKACVVISLPITPYHLALHLQEKLIRAKVDGTIPDVVLILQHQPVFTLGKFRGENDITVSREVLIEAGIDVVPTNRGGSITYHGPGQLVVYPILNLKKDGISVREYIWKLEESVINLLLDFGIKGSRKIEHPGVWVGEKKICSIGIHVSHWVTTHGLAINVNNNLQYYEYIRPCGLGSGVMTSISNILKRTVEAEAIKGMFTYYFSEIFGFKCESRSQSWLETLDS